MRTGWPFLVARGRTRDYRTVLVPDLLAGRGQQALLADALAIPDPESGVRIITLRPSGSEALLITARAEVLTSSTVGAAGEDPRDEHGRPLEFLYGVVQLPPAAEPDLAAAREEALASYRRFLADEEGFTFEVAPAFGETTAPRPMALPTAPAAPAQPHARQPDPRRPGSQQPGSQQPGQPRRALRRTAVSFAVLGTAVVLIVAWRQWTGPAPMPPPKDITVCTSQTVPNPPAPNQTARPRC